jgi:flagellar M-ring protein FliF
MTLSSNQLAYSRRLEEGYIKRIRDILVPIVGEEGVQAQVVADLDFTVVESTTESFEPDSKVVRSEETFQEESIDGGVMGVPGALTNKPPKGGTVDVSDVEEEVTRPLNSTRRATRNYEMDHSVSHTRTAPGGLQRLSAAVVVDYREQLNAEGKLERVPLGEEEMARITALVKDAIGFNAERNDSVNVTNVSFKAVEEMEPAPAAPVWQQPWIWDVAKQALGVMMVLLLVLGVLRPVMRSLAVKSTAVAALPPGEGQAAGQLPLAEDQLSLGSQQPAPAMSQEQQFGMAKSLVENDPQRAAEVMKTWVAADG